MNETIITKEKQTNKIQIVIESNRSFSRIKTAPLESNIKNPLNNNSSIQDKFRTIICELEQLVGLEEIKKLIFEIFALIHISQHRSLMGLKNEQQVFHMVFKGNPGTGKTTVARIMAKMFQEMGILSKGHLIEVERADLVGEYIGHTAQKTREHVKKALGGILFIDEAYSLVRGGDKDFGRESIDALVKGMEDYKNDFILILAGYSIEMEDFIQSNPGLHSRLPIQLSFEDYSYDQLMEIAEAMVKERDYILSSTAKHKLKQIIIEEKYNPLHTFSNARLVRNWVEKAIRNQSVRLISEQRAFDSKQALMTIMPTDFYYHKQNYFSNYNYS